MQSEYSNEQTHNCNLLCVACVLGASIEFPESLPLIKSCTQNQLLILQQCSQFGKSRAVIILYELMYWIDHDEAKVMPTFKKFNTYNCLTHGTKLLEIVQNYLSMFDSPSKQSNLLQSFQNKLFSLFKKESNTTTSETPSPRKTNAYFDSVKKCWVINGVASEETEDMSEMRSESPTSKQAEVIPAPLLPPPPPKGEDQQSSSYKHMRYQMPSIE